MTRAIPYTLWLEEPCLVAAPGGDPNTESSLDYIPGAVIRGALVAAYLRGGGSDGDDSPFNALFLNGGARYLNAYPLLEQRTLPAMRAWASMKDVTGQAAGQNGDGTPQKAEEKFYNRLDEAQAKEVDEGIPKAFGKPFVKPIQAGDATVICPEIDYEIAVHTARNRQKGRAIEGDASSALFRYRALARYQQFAGAVVLDGRLSDQDVTQLQGLLGGNLVLGGSHMAGYGLVRVEASAPADNWREMEGRPPAVAAGESFVVYLTSHAILYDPATGQPTSDIRPFLPGGPKVYTIEKSFAAATWVGGFNTHRGLPLAQQWAVQMGSAWRIRAERALSADELAAVEDAGIGLRREEGFGRLLFGPLWPEKPFEITKKPILAVPSAPEQAGPQDAVLLTRMDERLARRELDRLLAIRVNELAERSKIRGHLSRSQLGRLQVRIRQEAGTDNFNGFVAYLEGTTKRKSADDQFRKYSLSLDGHEFSNFRALLRELAKDPGSVWKQIGAGDLQTPHLGPQAFDYQTKELAHDYTVRFIADLCRQLSKQEVEQ